MESPNPSSLIILGFKALADPIRLSIVDRLRRQELCGCDLCDQMGIAQSKLSFHLKVLKTAELVRTRQEGRWIYYSLNLPQLVALEQYLSDIRRFSPLLPARLCPPEIARREDAEPLPSWEAGGPPRADS
ncbi:MAG: metalloregulator ArsR/SmtB family transcription factor [Leptolyngbya sp.]|nr:metalloregulator ArsR/SmtB family transcription factor [Leptolyngbya sp.]